MIVTIDGPAGAGKSSIAKALAERLGYRFLDTGAMYRSVALAAIRREIDWQNSDKLAQLTAEISIEVTTDRVLLDGEDVTQEIRSSEVTSVVRHAADNEGVRRRLVEMQRQIVGDHDYVTEGRDQGTVAFPHADVKFFLSASPAERARRRVRDLHQRGENVTFDEVLAEQTQRDKRDQARAYGGLVRADDAIEVMTDGLAPDAVVDRLETFVREKVPPT